MRQLVTSMLLQCTKNRDIRGPVHTKALSKVCLFVVIHNGSIYLRPHYFFDAFSTGHIKKFENDRVAELRDNLNNVRILQSHACNISLKAYSNVSSRTLKKAFLS